MAAVADRISPPGLQPRDVCLTVALSLLFHGLLTVAILLVPRFQVGSYITVPVSYTVNLVEAPPGGGGPSAAPGGASAPAPVQTAPSPAERPAPAARPAPRSAPTEELTLPGQRPARKPAPDREPSLRPPTTRQETPRPVAPVPISPVPMGPVAPATPAPAAPPVASVGPATGVGKGGGVEVAGTGSGTGTGAGGGNILDSYLNLVDWKIRENWFPVAGPVSPQAVVVVRFRVLRSRQVRDIELEESSGNGSLDAAALRAVRLSQPLPPFPILFTEPYLDLRYRFVMERG